jgi:hypothetical protein
MANIINQYGQVKLGVRYTSAPLTSTLWGNVFGVWNGEGTNNLTVKNAWNANGDAVDSKSGANGTIATPSGTSWTPSTMTYGSGKLGSGAFTFNGSNFVTLPDNTLNFTGDFSVSCWVYLTSTAGTNILLSFDNSSTPAAYNGWQIQCASDKAWLYIYNNGGSNRYHGISVPIPGINQWIHLTVTKTVGQEGNIYVNGVLGTKTTVSGGGGTSTMNPTYRSRAYIGAGYFLGSNPAYTPSPSGLKIDAIQTWDGTALDQTAVTELYNSGNGQEYPFTTSNALISSPNDAVSTNHGTLMNGCTFATGKIGKAFTFDGVNDYVALPTTSLNLVDDFSVSLWAYFNSFSNNGLVSNYYRLSPFTVYYGWSIIALGGKITFDTYNGVNATNQRVETSALATGNWYHIVVNYKEGVNTTIYINGTLSVTGNTTTPIGYSGNETPTIGGVQAGTGYQYPLNGKLDSVTVWNKVLTSTEVTELYNSGNGKQYPN